MKIRSLQLKVLLSYVFLIIAAFSLLSFLLDKNLEDNALRQLKVSIIDQAYLVENQFSPLKLEAANTAELQALAKNLGSKINSRITIIDARGKVIADSREPEQELAKMENHANRPEVRAALDGGIGQQVRYSSSLKINMLYVALPLKSRQGQSGVVRLAVPLAEVNKLLLRIRKAIILSADFALLLAFILSLFLAKGISGPIKKIIRVSRNFASGNFSFKINHRWQDEIGELADNLNLMAAELEEKIRQLNSQSQQLKAIFDGMVEGVIYADSQGRIISVNPAIEKIFQIEKREAEGKLLLESIRNNELSGTMWQVLGSGKELSREITLVYPVQRVFKVNAAAIFLNHAVNGCIMVIHDITEFRRLETVRKDFVANVSHELKTPLTSIKGFVETLMEGALEDKKNNRNFLKIIQEQSQVLDNLVSDLLSLSYLESKGATLDKTTFDLGQLVREVLAGFGAQLKEKGIGTDNRIGTGLLVGADKKRIQQVLVNLIDNAIKFNKDNGQIKLSAEKSGQGIKLAIEDTGIGIPQADIPRIFERFYRVDKARSRQMGGTGLGLSIVKHIIELHHGSLGVESNEGLGSQFWFILPV